MPKIFLLNFYLLAKSARLLYNTSTNVCRAAAHERSFMKIWKILSPKVLATEERPDNLTSRTQAKVKVTNVLLSGTELRAYCGTSKPRYPFVPGRFAVGVVGEAGEDCVKVEKNTRVFLHDATPCGKCEHCLAGNEDNCSNVQIAGVNTEGYLRDFVVTEESNLSPLPPSVSDTEALFAGIVATAENVIDKLNLSKGSHVAVFGAGELGNVLSQLLIYHQAVPILVDADEERLKTAAQCGIYYTVRANEEMLSEIERITGGRLACASVHTSYNNISPVIPFDATAFGGMVVYTGLSFPECTAQLKPAFDKQLTLTAVANDYSNIESAINLLLNKAVNLAPLHLTSRPVSQTEEAFKEGAAKAEKGENVPVSLLNMLS